MNTLHKNLFVTFFKIGVFTIGGGYAMIPVIERELVDKKHWLSADEFSDSVAVAQAVPGIIAVHMAIYMGHKLGGLKGAILSGIAVILPAHLIILSIAMLLSASGEWPFWLMQFFEGVRISVVALIAYAAYKLFINSKHSLRIPLAILSFMLVYLTSFSPFWIIIGFVLISILLPKREEQNGTA